MFYIVYTTLSALCMYFSCMNILPEKLSLFKKSIIFFSLLAITFLLGNRFGQVTTVFLFLDIIFLLFLFSHNKWVNLSCALFGYIFSVTFNYLCIWIAQYFLHMNLNQMAENQKITFTFSILFCLLCFIITKLLGKILNDNLKISTLLTDSYLNFSIFLSLTFLSGIYILNFSYGEFMGYSYSIIAFSGILYLLLFSTISMLMYNTYRKALKEEQYKNKLNQYDSLQSYTSELERLYVSMRQFKHDYVNILSTLSVYIDQEDTSALKEYFHHEILPISHSFSKSNTKLGTLANIKSLPLKSLLSSKLIYSMEKGIQTEIELPDIIDELPMEPIQLSRILGIFMDNAIEAALESEEKIIHFCLTRKDNRLIVIITNTSKPLNCPLADLSNFGVSSKGPLRGIGLNTVKNILNEYPLVTWDMEYQEPYFTQHLTLLYPERSIQ